MHSAANACLRCEKRNCKESVSEKLLIRMSQAHGGTASLGSLYSRNRGRSLLVAKQVVKDPRPLADKAYQSKCLAALVEFLMENKFPFSADIKKKINTPSKKDFERIFEFLFRYWDPSYVVMKIEDDALKILKMLNYPFIIKKSTFLTVNRMAWPALLGVLMWLVELNKLATNLDVSLYFQTSDFDSGDEKYMLLNYILTNYSNNINDPEKDHDFLVSLISKRYSIEGSVQSLEELQIKREKLAEVQREEEALNEVKKKNEALQVNIEKYEDYLAQMKKCSEAKEKECLESAQRLKEKEFELQELIKATESTEKLYNLQERLAKEEKTFWDLRIANSALNNKVCTMIQEFNKKYADLRTVAKDYITPLKKVDIPSAIKLHNNLKVQLPEFEIKTRYTVADDRVLKSEIIPALEKLKAYIMEQKGQVNNIIDVQCNEFHELVMKASELKIKVDLVKAQSVQKQRERDSNVEEFSQMFSRLEEQQIALAARLESKQKEVSKLDDLIIPLKQKSAAYNRKIHEARTMHELYRTKAKEIFFDMEKTIRDVEKKCDEIQAMMMMETNTLSEPMKKTKRRKRE